MHRSIYCLFVPHIHRMRLWHSLISLSQIFCQLCLTHIAIKLWDRDINYCFELRRARLNGTYGTRKKVEMYVPLYDIAFSCCATAITIYIQLNSAYFHWLATLRIFSGSNLTAFSNISQCRMVFVLSSIASRCTNTNHVNKTWNLCRFSVWNNKFHTECSQLK